MLQSWNFNMMKLDVIVKTNSSLHNVKSDTCKSQDLICIFLSRICLQKSTCVTQTPARMEQLVQTSGPPTTVHAQLDTLAITVKVGILKLLNINSRLH